MKFTKEQAFEKLKGFLTESGKKPLRMTELSLNRQLDTLMPILTDDETELDDFFEKSKESFKTMNSDAEFNNSNFAKNFEKEFKEQWEKDHPNQEPNKNEGGEGEKEGLSKAVLDRLKALEEKDAMHEAEKIKTTKRSELIKKLKEKKVDDTEWLNAYVNKVPISGDTDIDAEVNDALALYNRSNSHFDNNVTPQGVGGRVKEDEHRDDDVKTLLKRNRGINE
mgnify:CR=1 FL=1